MRKLEIGLVARETVAVVQRHFAIFATLAAAFIFVPSVVLALAFPHVASFRMPDPAHPQPLPVAFWLVVFVVVLVSLLGCFSIAAITADPDEGGGRSIGATIAGVIPKIGKTLIVFLWLILAEIVAIVVIALVAGLIAFAAKLAGVKPNGSSALIVGVGAVVVILPLMFWLMTRLAPLLGVLLREPISAYAAIKRAWRLSYGSGWRIFVLLLAMMIVSLVLQIVLYGIARATGAELTALPLILVRSAATALLSVYFYAGYGILYRHLAEA